MELESDDLAERTGIPRGKKRSHRGRSKKPGGDHRHHLHKAHEMLAKGDHAAAKRHAFDFVKSLGGSVHALEESIEAPKATAPAMKAPPGKNPLVLALMKGR